MDGRLKRPRPWTPTTSTDVSTVWPQFKRSRASIGHDEAASRMFLNGQVQQTTGNRKRKLRGEDYSMNHQGDASMRVRGGDGGDGRMQERNGEDHTRGGVCDGVPHPDNNAMMELNDDSVPKQKKTKYGNLPSPQAQQLPSQPQSEPLFSFHINTQQQQRPEQLSEMNVMLRRLHYERTMRPRKELHP